MDNPKLTLRDLLTENNINGKRVVVFDSHHFALLPWSDFARELGAPVRLLTLDYHTDTMMAFRGYLSQLEADGDYDETFDFRDERRARLALVDPSDEASLQQAVTHLRYDEHIDAAIRLGVIETAFVICHDGAGLALESNEQLALWEAGKTKISVQGLDGEFEIEALGTGVATGPFTYTLPEDRMVVLPERNVYSWSPRVGDEDRENRDAALVSEFLAERLALVDEICESTGLPKLFDKPFILDIDLDYFNTKCSVEPADSTVFNELVRRAGLITIAREPGCVRSCQLPGEQLNAMQLETDLLRLIGNAMSTKPT